jgi:hypothetical protein
MSLSVSACLLFLFFFFLFKGVTADTNPFAPTIPVSLLSNIFFLQVAAYTGSDAASAALPLLPVALPTVRPDLPTLRVLLESDGKKQNEKRNRLDTRY